jgi:uncharacterized membrane protein YkoI
MTNRKIILASAFALLTAGGVPATAWAAGQQNGEVNDKAEAQRMLQAKISLTAAIQAAESAESGKAISATFNGAGAKPGYEVEIVASDGGVQSFFVDSDTGQTTKAAVDAHDSEGGAGDENGEQGENGGNEAD